MEWTICFEYCLSLFLVLGYIEKIKHLAFDDNNSSEN